MEVSFSTPPHFDAVEGQLDVNTYNPASADDDQAGLNRIEKPRDFGRPQVAKGNLGFVATERPT